MTKLDSDKAPQSGRGSEQDRLSQSPLEIRRGSADPTDVTTKPLNLEFEPRDYDANERKPHGNARRRIRY
jgi:hypothetical protein